MTLPNIPPAPGQDWKSWATSLRDYLMKERAQASKATPTAPQLQHKKSGESAANDGVLIFNPVDDELEISVGGAWNRILRQDTAVLDDLNDVAITTPATNHTLIYDGSEWINDLLDLDLLDDVTIATPATNHTLIYDGSEWINDLLDLDLLDDVTITTPATNHTLIYDGSEWINSLLDLDLLDDVVITSPATNHTLIYDGTEWINSLLDLDLLDDVTITTPAAGDFLEYDGSGWVNLQPAYAQFAQDVDITAAAADTAYAITYDSPALAKNISRGSPTSRIVFTEAGTYHLTFTAQISSTSSSTVAFRFWPRINGSNVTGSTIVAKLHQNDASTVVSRSAIFFMSANDYLEVMWATDSTSGLLKAEAATAYAPAAPSTTLSIARVSA